jgi:hypothetical protein
VSGEKVCVVCRCEPAKSEHYANAMHLSKAGAAAAYRGTCADFTTQSDSLQNLDVNPHGLGFVISGSERSGRESRCADGFASATTQLPASLDGPDSEINLRASVCL